MKLKFTLVLPPDHFWQGRWSVVQKKYFLIRRYSEALAMDIVRRHDCITCHDERGKQAFIKIDIADLEMVTQLRCCNSFSWMVDEIEQYGKVLKKKESI